MIRQSMTWQATMNKGTVLGYQQALLLLGTRKFGPPDDTTRSLLTGQTNLERLERMIAESVAANTWQELLATP